MITRRIFTILAACAMSAGMLLAEGIDGKWNLKFERPEGAPPAGEGQRGGQRGGGMRGGGMPDTALELKADGDSLTGKMIMKFRGQERAFDISDGKMDGNKFEFITKMETRRGEMTLHWEGELEGEEIKGFRKRDGSQGQGPGQPFTGKKE
jgi:hypothetical protein